MRVPLLVVPVAILTAIVGWGEWTHKRASGRRLGSPRHPPHSEAIVVLGFRNRGVCANYLNRYRVRAGLRSIDPTAPRHVLVLCGGSVGSSTSEAELMARYARQGCGYTGPIRLDCASRTTWENIQNAVPLVEGCDTIKIVSNSLHAEKARAYLWKQRPDLAERLARAKDYRFGELIVIKPLAACVGLWSLRPAAMH